MMNGSLPRRYARALLEIGKEDNLVERFAKELEVLSALLTTGGNTREHPSSLAILANDRLPQSERVASIAAIADKLGLHPLLKNFLSLVVQKERIAILPEISQEYRDFQDELLGIVRVVVTTPQAPSAELLEKTEKILSQKLGKKFMARGVADPSLLGGIVLEVGHTVYDGSVRRELEKIQSVLKG